MVRSGCLALVSLLFSGSGCLLYTDDINHPPEVELTGDMETTFNTKPRPQYRAVARDPDQSAESLSFEWHRQLGDCPADLLAPAPKSFVLNASSSILANEVDLESKFCVWVVVRDKHGATDAASVVTNVKHESSVAVVEVVKPAAMTAMGNSLPLMSDVQLSGAKSRDPEGAGPLKFDWTLTRDGEDVNSFTHCLASDSELCFTGEQPGTYVATLTVRDSRGTMGSVSKPVVIAPDAPPCIELTVPMHGLSRTEPARIVRDADDPMNNFFEVKYVKDDVDPYPQLETRPSMYGFRFTWWKQGDKPSDPPWRRTDDNGLEPALKNIDHRYYQNGDTGFVRLQVNDRIPRNFAACDPDRVHNCALDGRPNCFQWVTWQIDFRSIKDM